MTEGFNEVLRTKREKKNARYIPTYTFINFMPSQQTEKREIEFKNFSFFYHFIVRDDKLIGSLSASGEEEIVWKIGMEKVMAVDRAEKRGWKADLTAEGESCSAMTEAMKKREKRKKLREKGKKRASKEIRPLQCREVLVRRGEPRYPHLFPSSSSDNASGHLGASIDLLMQRMIGPNTVVDSIPTIPPVPHPSVSSKGGTSSGKSRETIGGPR